MTVLHGLILLILPNVLAFSFVKPAQRRFIVTGDNNIVIGNTIINNGNTGGSADLCVDDSACPQIMAAYNLCQNTETARKVCPKVCNLCTGSRPPSPVGPASNGNCKDFSTKCAENQHLYHICEYQLTAERCPKTCNLCNKPFHLDACHDNSPGCWTVINPNRHLHVCDKESNAKLCPKSCNKC